MWFHPDSSIFHCGTQSEETRIDDEGEFDRFVQRGL